MACTYVDDCNCRKGFRSWELHRELAALQKAAPFMLQRLRLAMQDDLSGGMLNSEVEVDEAFIDVRRSTCVGIVRSVL